MVDYLDLPGLTTIARSEIGESEIIVDAEGGVPPRECQTPGCHGGVLLGHGSKTVVYHDEPRGSKWVRIRFKRRRVRCSACGATASYEADALDSERVMTKRLIAYIQRRCLQATFSEISRAVGVNEITIRRIAREHIDGLNASRQIEPPAILGLDEFLVYDKPSAILTNIGEQTVYDVLEGRTKEFLRPALQEIIASRNLRLVVTDMYYPYLVLLRKIAPRTPIVIDRFHVVRMANDALDEVRKSVQRNLPPEDRKSLLRERRVLFANGSDLTPSARELRDRWLRRIPKLRQAYEAKEAFLDIYRCASRTEGETAFLKLNEPLETQDTVSPLP
ncbi:ISL3 family transposase [Azotobacter vinelandii]